MNEKWILQIMNFLNEKPVDIGLCYNISYNNSAIFRIEFEADRYHLEDKGRSDTNSAKFVYDFKNGLLLDWKPSIYDHLRPNDHMKFSLYCKEQFLFRRYKNNFDDYNEDTEFEILEKISKILPQDKVRTLIEEIITEISPITNLL